MGLVAQILPRGIQAGHAKCWRERPTQVEVPNDQLEEYNAALKIRGSLLIWLDRDICWPMVSAANGAPPEVYESAIHSCQTIMSLFNLALRQAMGMVQSLLTLVELD